MQREEVAAVEEFLAASGDVEFTTDGTCARSATATRSPRKRAALQSLRGYLQPHEHHLDYPTRLAEGRSIGSGQIEGACKNLIGRRLKQTSARWRVQRANRVAGLCSIIYSNQWNPYWESRNA